MPDPTPPEEAKRRLRKVIAELEGKEGLLVECAREMEGAAFDFDVFANLLAERCQVHPFTLRPQGLRELVDRIRRELPR